MRMIQGKQRNKPRKKLKLKKITQKPQNNSFKIDLPEDLIFTEILTRLPVNSLTQFKLVSKKWHTIISSTQFIKSHLECTISNPFVPTCCIFIKTPYYFYILNYDAYDGYPDDHQGEKGLVLVKDLSFSDNGVNTFLIGSCNGLVCFGRGNYRSGLDYSFNVCNPLMGEKYSVLDPLGNFGGNLIYGFGYVSSMDDYVLFVGGLQKRSSECFVYVHSLRSKKWNKIGVFHQGNFVVVFGGKGVLVNETLHWDMNQVRVSSVENCILGFDLVDNTFKYVPMPVLDASDGQCWEFRLCEMGGSLYACGVDMIYGEVEMWMLKQYGTWDSWIKLFKIDDMVESFWNLVGLTKNGKVLVETYEGSVLLADSDQNQPKYTTLVKDLGDIEVVKYVRSAVSPLL